MNIQFIYVIYRLVHTNFLTKNYHNLFNKWVKNSKLTFIFEKRFFFFCNWQLQHKFRAIQKYKDEMEIKQNIYYIDHLNEKEINIKTFNYSEKDLIIKKKKTFF